MQVTGFEKYLGRYVKLNRLSAKSAPTFDLGDDVHREISKLVFIVKWHVGTRPKNDESIPGRLNVCVRSDGKIISIVYG